MIKIKITNVSEIVASNKGRLISKIAPFFLDLETRVEEEIVRQIRHSFDENNIKAIISIEKET